MEDNKSKDIGSKKSGNVASKYMDIISEDDRAILGNNGQDLDELPIKLEIPDLEILGRDFNGE